MEFQRWEDGGRGGEVGLSSLDCLRDNWIGYINLRGPRL